MQKHDERMDGQTDGWRFYNLPTTTFGRGREIKIDNIPSDPNCNEIC